MSLQDLAARGRALIGGEGWIVGGAVRDHMLGRPFEDWDVVVQGDPGAAARAHARRTGGAPFPLSERHGAWRVVDDGRVVDFTALHGSLPEDLARRDFTAGAVAVALADGEVTDPHRGLDDINARVLRAVSDRVFGDDPLRLLRLPRLAAELEFSVDEETARIALRDAHLAPAAAGERQLAELQRILAVRDPVDAISLCDELGVLAAVLPEVDALHDVEQSAFHHLDVFHHTLHVIDATADVAANVAHFFPDPEVAAAIEASLAAPLDGTMDVRAGLRWGALLHDIAKPYTRTVLPDGGVKFWGHDERGVAMLDVILGRFNASGALRELTTVLVREHLTLGFMIPQRPLDRRAFYRYALATRPYALPSVVLSLGDRLATRGARTRQRGLRRHLQTAQEIAAGIVALGSVPPRLVAPADRIAEQVGLAPGPSLGRLVAALQEEQAAGVVESEQQAVEFARSWLASSA
jgi:putative nucleotidyltransferase with HDIG domain